MNRRIFTFSLVVLVIIVTYFVLRDGQQPDELIAQVVSTPESIQGFARALPPAQLTFPDDFGSHPDYQTEWWYYTGNLDTSDGRHFGYELTFFRRGLLPANQALPRTSDWATNQIYMAHFALTDVDSKTFYAFERFSRGAAGLAGVVAEPFAAWLEDWRVELISQNTYSLDAENEGIRLHLEMFDSKGPVLQGDNGYSQKGPDPGNASYYYSETYLESQGQISIGSETFKVSGSSWKDHEYSTAVLSTEQIGWDWFSIQLDNGYDLMLYQIRRTDGSIDPFSSGTLIGPDGSTQQLSRSDFTIMPQGSWHSPHSDAEYPMGWRIQIPSASVDLTLVPYMEDQELNLTFTYWEGAISVQGTHDGIDVSGVGYTEMTGYAQPFDGGF